MNNPQPNTSRPKVLIIDDEEALLRSIMTYLTDSNFVTYGAENGKDGLEVFAREKPDLVLTDLHMPTIGGLEVLSKITQQDPETPVLVISGAGELNDAIAALRLGARDYITKPISDMAVLEHAINKALEHKRLLEQNKAYAEDIAQNLKILEQDQAAGRHVQMSLLPQDNLCVDQYTCKFKIIPSLELSGDFVEYFTVNDEYLVCYLADVSGHGASSAFVTVLLKSFIAQHLVKFSAQQDDTIVQPAKLMQAISNEIFQAKLSKYLTLVYAVQNLRTNVLTYSIGGHYPSPILYTPDGTTVFIPGNGFPIGIMAAVEYQQQELIMQPGSRLVMFSDGVLEVFMLGSTLDEKDIGLLALVKNCKDDIPAIMRGCGVTTTTKTNGVQPDDITVLTLSRS